MLQYVVAATLVAGLMLAPGGFSQTQCFSQTDCAGDHKDTATPRACCAGTDEGLYYRTGSSDCTRCVVHGFTKASYSVVEGKRLDTFFELYVKGMPQAPVLRRVLGSVTAEADTASDSDFDDLGEVDAYVTTENQIPEESRVLIRLFTTNDEITLEYDDTISLMYSPPPQLPNLVEIFENMGEFIRNIASVTIIDNDQLEINFGEADYSIGEGSTDQLTGIRLQFRNTQENFTLILIPVSIAYLRASNASTFISATIDSVSRATPGADHDFMNVPFNITIPATQGNGDAKDTYLPERLIVIDDDVNEIEQSFALIAQLGDDVPDEFACFQTQVGDTDCFGRTGATEIKIEDNDPMVIGFPLRRRTVSESEAQQGADTFLLTINVFSVRPSEREYVLLFRVLEGISNATVEMDNSNPQYDATFGTRDAPNAPIEARIILAVGRMNINLPTSIRNDFSAEDLECYTLRILPADVDGIRDIFTCMEDEDEPMEEPEPYCQHTICIEDDDEPFVIAFVQTVYTVVESEGQVEVCVNLTRPEIDILEETVRVNVYNNRSSIYIPSNAVLATPDPPSFFSAGYSMIPMSDYEEQTSFSNRIRHTAINATRRVICYNQIVYDDKRLEVSEYAGLTLAVRDSSVFTIVEREYDQVAIEIVDDDNDTAVVGLEETLYHVSEDVGVVEVCAIVYSPNIACPIAFPFNVTLTTANDTATASLDYSALSVILSFNECEEKSCANATILDDEILENLETFNVTLARTVGLDSRITLDPVHGVIEITDNDDAIVGLERTLYSVTEGVGEVEVCAVVYSPNSECPVGFSFDVILSTINGSAVPDMDYLALPSLTLLMFNECQNRVCANVSILDDLEMEMLVEKFDIALERADDLDGRITLNPENGAVEITDNDVAVVGLEETFYQVTEGDGVVEVCAVVYSPDIPCPINFPFSVVLSTKNDTAVPPSDYESLFTTLSFGACGTRSCVDITIVDDSALEVTESFDVTLDETSDLDDRITLGPVDGEIVIIDEDVAVVGLEHTVYTVTEGTDDVVEVCVLVLNPAVPCPIAFSFDVRLTFVEGTADASMDYTTLSPIVLTFGECDVRRCVNVSIDNDLVIEAEESFAVTLEEMEERITISREDGNITIIDDDNATVGFEETFYQVDETEGVVEVCIVVFAPIITCPIAVSFNVVLSTSNKTAVSPVDYTALTTDLTFGACQNRSCENISIENDSVLEVLEEFELSLERTNDLDLTITLIRVNGVVEITDDDVAVVGLEESFYSVNESVGVVEVCVVVYQPSSVTGCPIEFPFNISLSSVDGSADAAMDFLTLDANLTFACDERVCVSIKIHDDMVPELIESFSVTLERTPSLDDRITLDPVIATIEIIDTNEAIVGLEPTNIRVIEDVGQVELCAAVFEPLSDCPITFPFNVSLSTTDGSAGVYPDGDSPMDYEGLSTVLSFAACDERSCVNVTIVDDLVDEQIIETFTVTLGRTTDLDGRIMLNPVNGLVEIECNDVPISVGYEFTVYNTTESQGEVQLCAIISVPSFMGAPRAFNLSITTSNGTAVSPADYVAVSGQPLQFSQGDTSRCHTITINQDGVCEDQLNEEFFSFLTLSSGIQPISVVEPFARVVILEDEEPECNPITVGYEFSVYSTTEGQVHVELCAVISTPANGSPRDFTLLASTENNTAVSPDDYDEVTDVHLDFVVGQNRSCHVVNINDDDICESDSNENFYSNLVLGGGVLPIIVEPPQTQVVIDDTNEPECGPITVGYEFVVYTTDETAGVVQICAIIYEPMTGGAPRDFVVSSITRDGSAKESFHKTLVAGADYGSQSVNLTFVRGSMLECHNVSILQDDDCEQPPEDFFADLAYVSGIQPIDINIPTTQVIIDDSGELECDEIVVGYEFTEYITSESAGFVQLCAVVTSHPGGALRSFTISASTEDGTEAIAGTDYTAVVGEQLVFAQGAERVCHNVSITQDNICEVDAIEDFFSNLEYVSGILPIIIMPPRTRVIVDDTNEPECGPIIVGYEFVVYTTDETAGMVQICAIIYEPMTGGAPRDFVVSSTTRDGSASADYGSQSVNLTFVRGSMLECHNVSILQDDDCEQPPEDFFADLAYVSGIQPIDINIPTTQVIIDDSGELECDEIVVGYEFTEYITSESAGFVQLCAVVTSHPGGALRSFTISASTEDGTEAIAGTDYTAVVGEQLVFAQGAERVCHNVSITQDNICEVDAIEDFFSNLEYVSGILPILIMPPRTRVIIDDTNEPECGPIIVGYEFVGYTTDETAGMVQICAIIYQPMTGGAPRDFVVSSTTRDGSASADYGSQSVNLTFVRGAMLECHNVSIFQDDDCEQPPEDFFADLAYVSGIQPININIPTTRVIIDDSGELECDEIVVGYEFTEYITSESGGFVQLCAVVTSHPGGALRSFTISASTEDGTEAIAGTDYTAVVGEQLVFAQGAERVCHNVSITQDNVCEVDAIEDFFSNLEYVSGILPILIMPPRTRVIVDDTNEPECGPIIVGYEFVVYTTDETAGMVQICAIIYQPMTGGAPRDFVVSSTTRDGSASADYGSQSVNLTIVRGSMLECHNVSILQDDDCEQPPEDFFADLAHVSGIQPININIPTTQVIIDDSGELECDEIVVGYEFTEYITSESAGFVQLCAVVTSHPGGALRSFTISASTEDGTEAIAGTDYTAVVGEQLVFAQGAERVCHNVSITQDNICEVDAIEDFFSNLEYVSGILPIIIMPPRTRVIIDDTNEPECEPIRVGYEFTVYTTPEGNGTSQGEVQVQLCAVIYEPISGGAPRDFVISSTTRDGSAVAGTDYVAQSINLTFSHGDMEICHTVDILQDDECEPMPENFFSDLEYVSGIQTIDIMPDTTEVFIDDSNEPECADIVVGYEKTVYTTPEGDTFVELCVIIHEPLSGVTPRPFIISHVTEDDTAVAPEDYISDSGQLVFSTGDDGKCHSVQIVNDDICETELEYFTSNLALVSGISVTVGPASTRVIIGDLEDCVGVLVNDTLTGDPLMTIPIFSDPNVQPGNSIPSLCYEVHGEADQYFNLISDKCTTVNAYYEKAQTNSSNDIDLNVVTQIGVRAVGNDSECRDIEVDLDMCTTKVAGQLMNTFVGGGISVKRYNVNTLRVRIAVPNCADTMLVMWVFCASGRVADPEDWKLYDTSFIRFVVMRGLNLHKDSHGLIGQFWNVPVTVEEHTGFFNGQDREDDYNITVHYPGTEARSFVGLKLELTWEFEERVCYYVGNRQGGVLAEVTGGPVIEGEYTDYKVTSIFATSFTYSHFDEDQCSVIA